MDVQATQGTLQSFGAAWTGKEKRAAGAVRTAQVPPPKGLSERVRHVREMLDTRPQTVQELYERLYTDLHDESLI